MLTLTLIRCCPARRRRSRGRLPLLGRAAQLPLLLGGGIRAGSAAIFYAAEARLRSCGPAKRGNRMQVDNDQFPNRFSTRVSSVFFSLTHVYNVFLRTEFEPRAPRRPEPGVRASPSALGARSAMRA